VLQAATYGEFSSLIYRRMTLITERVADHLSKYWLFVIEVTLYSVTGQEELCLRAKGELKTGIPVNSERSASK